MATTLTAGKSGGPAVEVEMHAGGMHAKFLEQRANERWANGYKIQRVVFEPGQRAMYVIWERFR